MQNVCSNVTNSLSLSNVSVTKKKIKIKIKKKAKKKVVKKERKKKTPIPGPVRAFFPPLRNPPTQPAKRKRTKDEEEMLPVTRPPTPSKYRPARHHST
jgi:hypothetical protein